MMDASTKETCRSCFGLGITLGGDLTKCPDCSHSHLSSGSLPNVGNPEGIEPFTNLLYRNQYGTWTSVMAKTLMTTTAKMLGVDEIIWIESKDVDFLLANTEPTTL